VTRSRRLLLSLMVVSVATPLLLASTSVAMVARWKGFSVPDAPLLKNFWAPWLVVLWWQEWDGEARRLFMPGFILACVPAVLGVGSLGYRWWSGQLNVFDDGPPMRVAEAGSVAELKAYGRVSTSGPGVVIGKHGSDILRVHGDGHALTVGRSGAGKGTGVIVPTLLEHPGTILAHDPAHELARITHRYRASLGPVYVFDPTDRYCTHFNPLLEMRDGDQRHGDCETLGTLLALSGESHDPIWEEAASQIVTALLLVAFEHGNPTLAYVHDLLMSVCANRFPKTGDTFCTQVFKAHEADHHKITSSVNFTMRSRMKFMSDPVVRATTSHSGFRAGDLFCNDEPVTVYITVPPPDRKRMTLLLSAIIQMIMNTGLYLPTHVSDGREKTRDMTLLFDEFPTLHELQFLKMNIAECRKYGIRCVLACQELGQIREAYGENESITANCATKVFMPGFSPTLEEVARWGGEQVKMHHSSGRQMMRPLSGYSSESEGLMPALSTREMIVRGREQVLVFQDGCLPVYLDRIDYRFEPRWQGMWDA
jgi:type IV secretion system protein VirD4